MWVYACMCGNVGGVGMCWGTEPSGRTDEKGDNKLTIWAGWGGPEQGAGS